MQLLGRHYLLYFMIVFLVARSGTVARDETPAPATISESGAQLETIVSGLDKPRGMDFLPDGRLLIHEGYLYASVRDRGNRHGARPEIWTWGHRNPQGMALHPQDGSIWISEHGPRGGDELNRLMKVIPAVSGGD